MLEVVNLKFFYNPEKIILKDISFTVGRGDILCLLGPNGTGKTTLLRCLLAINKPQGGSIRMDGDDITKTKAKKRAKYMAYVPQAVSMAFPYEGREVVMMGRTAHFAFGAGPGEKDRLICDQALKQLGILELADRQFNQMSGGERQMILVARAIAQQAEVLVMDEPTANLDYSNQIRILQIVSELAEQGYSIIMTTHFPDHAFLACNHVALMRDGMILKQGAPYEVIVSDNLTELYQTQVFVTEVILPGDNTTKVCVPIIKKAEQSME